MISDHWPPNSRLTKLAILVNLYKRSCVFFYHLISFTIRKILNFNESLHRLQKWICSYASTSFGFLYMMSLCGWVYGYHSVNEIILAAFKNHFKHYIYLRKYRVTTFNQLIAYLINLDETFNDEYLALMLLPSIPDEYDHLITTLLIGKDKVSFDR